jgi:hypothetical protein
MALQTLQGAQSSSGGTPLVKAGFEVEELGGAFDVPQVLSEAPFG